MRKDLEGFDKELYPDTQHHSSEKQKIPPLKQPITINQLNDALNDAADLVMAGSIPCLSSSLRLRNAADERRLSDGVISHSSHALRKALSPKNVARGSGKVLAL